MTKWLRFLPFMIFLVLGVFFLKGLGLNAREVPSVMIGKKIPAFVLPRLEDGVLQSSTSLRGQAFLLNVWASWCQVCQEEQDFLMNLAAQGVPIYGLNYKDDSLAAQKWLHDLGNPYRWTVSDQSGRLALDLGVYGAPETFLIDAKGVILYRHAGPLTTEVWEKMQRLL